MAADVTFHLRTADGRAYVVKGRAGRSLMREATDAGVAEIAADCGGCLTCATCHVIVDAAWAAKLTPPSADELAMLELTAAPREPTSRLSCQIELTPQLNGLGARLPANQY
jgi:ferredoxin, 2Fe-2S